MVRTNSLLNFLILIGFIWLLVMVFFYPESDTENSDGNVESSVKSRQKDIDVANQPVFDDFEDNFAAFEQKKKPKKMKIKAGKVKQSKWKLHAQNLDPPPLSREVLDLHRVLNLTNPGHMGKPVKLPQFVPSDIQQKINQSWEIYAINEFVSNLIPLYRDLPDVRPEYCKKLQYSDNLPVTSVVMVFHNEPFSMIMRSVFAVFKRTPPDLLGEIVLVDDRSDRGLCCWAW